MGIFLLLIFILKIILLKKQKVANVAKVSEAGEVGDRLGKRFTVGTVVGWAGHGGGVGVYLNLM